MEGSSIWDCGLCVEYFWSSKAVDMGLVFDALSVDERFHTGVHYDSGCDLAFGKICSSSNERSRT